MVFIFIGFYWIDFLSSSIAELITSFDGLAVCLPGNSPTSGLKARIVLSRSLGGDLKFRIGPDFLDLNPSIGKSGEREKEGCD